MLQPLRRQFLTAGTALGGVILRLRLSMTSGSGFVMGVRAHDSARAKVYNHARNEICAPLRMTGGVRMTEVDGSAIKAATTDH